VEGSGCGLLQVISRHPFQTKKNQNAAKDSKIFIIKTQNSSQPKQSENKIFGRG
jgi:pyruvate/2-oxoacid:ferredoxin oxidoreductase alpha subunit